MTVRNSTEGGGEVVPESALFRSCSVAPILEAASRLCLSAGSGSMQGPERSMFKETVVGNADSRSPTVAHLDGAS